MGSRMVRVGGGAEVRGGRRFVYVPVIMLEFQQSVSYENLEVPHLLSSWPRSSWRSSSSSRWWTFQLCRRDRYLQCCPSCSRCSSWRLSTCPLLCNDRCAQLQFVDKLVNIPIVAQRQIPMVPCVQKTTAIPLLQCVDKVVFVPVVQVVQVSPVQLWRRQAAPTVANR